MMQKKRKETHAERSIRHCLDMIAPFEASEPDDEKEQREFYQFMVTLYEEMYENPEKYLVFPGPYEEYMDKRKRKNEKKEKEHVSDSRESTLRNTFQQAISFYALFLYQSGLRSDGLDEKTGSLILRKDNYQEVLDKVNRIHESHYNCERFRILQELGVRIIEKKGYVFIAHEKRKRAMAGLLYLCKAPESKYKWMNFLRLDYKNAYSKAPTVRDICQTLPAEYSEIVECLEEHLSGIKVRAKIKPLRGIVSDFKWKVEYASKGKNICGFYADNETFMLCIYFNHFQNINEFAGKLLKENIELFQWFKNQFPERLCKCPNNRRVDFGGEFRRICGLSNRAEIVNPDNEDIKNALYILSKYRNIHDK